MQQLLQDIFREAINKAKQIGIWDKLTMEQREALVTKALLHSFMNAVAPKQQGPGEVKPVVLCKDSMCFTGDKDRATPDRILQFA